MIFRKVLDKLTRHSTPEANEAAPRGPAMRKELLLRLTPKGGNVDRRVVRRRRAANKRARASRKANR